MSIKLDMYLSQDSKLSYANTKRENELVEKFTQLYTTAKSYHDGLDEASPANLDKWRRAYKGTLNALNKDGGESKRNSTPLRKLVYELVESKIDNSVPMPKIAAKYKSDVQLCDITENYLKYEMDQKFTRFDNDRYERATYIDGTTWFKVCWDSTDSTHNTSGNVRVECKLCDQVYPQPGIVNFRDLEYIFEVQKVSVTKIYQMYNRVMSGAKDGLCDVVSCYYKNDNDIVGLFSWNLATNQVICDEEDWQIRKLRKCKTCGTIVPIDTVCPTCGSKSFSYEICNEEILEDDLYEVYNPYEAGETDDVALKDKYETRIFAPKGTHIPFYRVRELPFVPRPCISSINSMYGLSEVFTILDMQDAVNKILTKAVDKTMKSGAVVTQPESINIRNVDDTYKVLKVKTAEQAAMVSAKQITADTSQDIIMAGLIYESSRATSGITESFQGRKDSSAASGKAKELQTAQTAGRLESLRVMKASAFAAVYELMLKYLLAFSDEPRKFVKILPDGSEKQLTWNKYLFLDRDKNGRYYYRDDLSFNTDPAATLSQNRLQMWQETQDKFISGAFGNPQDPRVLRLFWNTMNELGYPLAKTVLAGLTDMEQHLPADIEQALMSNPDAIQLALGVVQEESKGSGGARSNSGPEGNGKTHPANVETTNQRNRAAAKSPVNSAQDSIGGA